MKILHVLASSDRADGGAVQAVMDMAPFQVKKGAEVTIFAPGADGVEMCYITETGVNLKIFPKTRMSKYWFGFSLPLMRALFREVPQFDMVHTHGTWYFPQFIAYWAAKKAQTPLIASTHGELSDVRLRYRAFKKKIYSAVIQKKILREAAAVHALSPKEAEDIMNYAPANKLVIIPNGVDSDCFEQVSAQVSSGEQYAGLNDKKIILFLGRIEEGKGLDLLARSAGILHRKRDDMHLLIAGPDNWGYGSVVRQILQEEGVLSRVTFTGLLTGQKKLEALGHADMFVLPSKSEGFSIALLEAMACGLPVIISRQCNFPEVEEKGCGIVIDTDAGELSEAISVLLDDPGLSKEMGARGKQLVRESYTLGTIADEMINAYKEVIDSQ